MKKLILLVLSIISTACSKQANTAQILDVTKGLDLENITFKEDALALLKGKIDSTNVDTGYIREGYSAPFDYPEGYKFNPWNGDASLYGKAYYSTENDSIAHYKDLYFNRMAFLTHNNKLVAVLASGDVPKEELYTRFKNQLQEVYGEPTFSPQTDQDVFYEFSAGDRYLQIDYGKGNSVTFSSDGTMENTSYYTISLLIFNKEAADEIKKIQDDNYKKTGDYKILPGDFKIYKHDPNSNVLMLNEIYSKTYNP